MSSIAFPQVLTGDTDQNSNGPIGGRVFYDHHGFSLKVIESLCDQDRYDMVNYFDLGNDGEVFRDKEVIGNIYENPELLKQ